MKQCQMNRSCGRKTWVKMAPTRMTAVRTAAEREISASSRRNMVSKSQPKVDLDDTGRWTFCTKAYHTTNVIG